MIFYLSTKSYKDQKKNSLNDRSTLACLKAIYYQGLSGRLCVYVVVVLSKCVPDVCMLLCKEKRDYVIFVLYRMSHKQHLHLRIIYNLLCCHDLMCASQCILISDWSLQNIYLSSLSLSLLVFTHSIRKANHQIPIIFGGLEPSTYLIRTIQMDE